MDQRTSIHLAICVATSVALVLFLARRPYLFIKPSIVVVISFHVLIQWSAVLDADNVYSFLPDSLTFWLLVHGFPLLGLGGSLFVLTGTAREVFNRLRNPTQISTDQHRRAMLVLSIAVLGTVGLYLLSVPLSDTGLYALFTRPKDSTEARENSLKLLDSAFLKYAYSFMVYVFSPMLAVLCTQWFLSSASLGRRAVAVSTIVGLLIASSITGARSYSMFTLLAIFLSLVLRRGARRRLPALVAGGFAMVMPGAAITIVREGRELSVSSMWTGIADIIVGRILYSPMEVSLWYVHYAQTVGYLGISAIPKLAALAGEPAVKAPNLIGKYYMPWALDSISANGCYVFTYYSYFGLAAFPVCLAGLLLLDSVLLACASLSDLTLAACLVTMLGAATNFASADYTPVLVTNGFAIAPIFAFGLEWLVKQRRQLPLVLAEN